MYQIIRYLIGSIIAYINLKVLKLEIDPKSHAQLSLTKK